MQKRLHFDSQLLKVTISRLCQQLIEVHDDFSNSALVGMQPRGIFLAERIKAELEKLGIKGFSLAIWTLRFTETTFVAGTI